MSRFIRRIVVTVVILLLLPGAILQIPKGHVQADNQDVKGELVDFVPSWVQEGGKSEMLKRMADPELRQSIGERIDYMVNEQVKDGSDIRFPEEGKTLEDWMTDFDQETNFDYQIEPGKALWSLVNLNNDSGNTFYVDEFKVNDLNEGKTAFEYDFKGDDGDAWDTEAFGDDLFSYPEDPDAVTYSIEDNTGKMEIDKRRKGKASSYGKLTSKMEELDNSEILMRFRVDQLPKSQWLRLWVQSDKFSSGSSFARNGYGIAMNLGTDKLTLQRRESGKTTELDSVSANMTTDWHWLKLRASDGKVAVSLWNDDEEEPEDWNIEYDVPEVSKKAMLSFSNLDKNNENTFYIDDLTVESSSENDPVFQYDFNGENDTEWESEAFDILHSHPDEMTFSIKDNTGKIELGKREGPLSATYGKIVPHMKNPKDSDLLMRFRPDKVGNDQWMRAFVRADEFLDGNSLPLNGYGIELNLKTDQLTLIGTENRNVYQFDKIDANMTTDWHWLRLHVQGDELAVRIWKDGDDEPEDWDMIHEVSENVSPGEAIMRILMLRGNLKTVYVPAEDGEEPEEQSIKEMKAQVKKFRDEKEIGDDTVARQLQTHLTAVEHYEKTGKVEKAIKHMKGFKKLLKHQKGDKLITEKAYQDLNANADQMIKKWG